MKRVILELIGSRVAVVIYSDTKREADEIYHMLLEAHLDMKGVELQLNKGGYIRIVFTHERGRACVIMSVFTVQYTHTSV